MSNSKINWKHLIHLLSQIHFRSSLSILSDHSFRTHSLCSLRKKKYLPLQIEEDCTIKQRLKIEFNSQRTLYEITEKNDYTQDFRLSFYIIYSLYQVSSLEYTFTREKKRKRKKALPCSPMMTASTNLPIFPGKSLLSSCKPTQINIPHMKNNTSVSL